MFLDVRFGGSKNTETEADARFTDVSNKEEFYCRIFACVWRGIINEIFCRQSEKTKIRRFLQVTIFLPAHSFQLPNYYCGFSAGTTTRTQNSNG